MKPKSNYIDPVQFGQILDNIPRLNSRKWQSKDIEFLFRIAYWCGLRMIEARHLKAENFDLDMREIYLGKTKTKKEDYAPIPDLFIPELRNYLKDKHGPLLDPTPNRMTVTKWLSRLGSMLDIQALTTPQEITGEKTKSHIFRKTIGKDLIYGTHGKKAPLNVVQKQLRHANINTTSKYLKVGIEDVKAFWSNIEAESSESS